MIIFQKIADAIKNWRPPLWLRQLLQSLNDLMIELLKTAGQAYVDYLKTEIIYAAEQNWTAREKFDYVFKQAKQGFIKFGIDLKDNQVNLLVNYLVSLLKKESVIK